MRYGLTEGDFDRVDRQQNFLRAVMAKVLADDTIGNPLTFSNTLESITNSLTIDQSWSNGQLRSLAFSLRGLDPDKVRFMTLPFARYDSVPTRGR